MDTLIEGLKIGKEKVILMKLQNFGVRMIRLSLVADEMSHRVKESTEGYQNKALVGKEAPSVCGAMEIVCQFYGTSVKCVDWK